MFVGLYHDDIIYNFPDVEEAVRRLPKAMKEERDWRAIRAIQLDLNHELLPPEEWIQYEEVGTQNTALFRICSNVLFYFTGYYHRKISSTLFRRDT